MAVAVAAGVWQYLQSGGRHVVVDVTYAALTAAAAAVAFAVVTVAPVLIVLAAFGLHRWSAATREEFWPYLWRVGESGESVDEARLAWLLAAADLDDARDRLVRRLNRDEGTVMQNGIRVPAVTAAMIPEEVVRDALEQAWRADLTYRRYAALYGVPAATALLDADCGAIYRWLEDYQVYRGPGPREVKGYLMTGPRRELVQQVVAAANLSGAFGGIGAGRTAAPAGLRE